MVELSRRAFMGGAVALTLDGHDAWTRRFAGHVENYRPSRTG
jgi:hypothetical protein